MCGICGIAGLAPEPAAADRVLLDQMIACLEHRGPDRAGGLFRGGAGAWCGLGHRRLSVIDLSGAADQPLCNEDGSIHVVFNGEIYNYRELTRELEARGHRFRSKSDTEVLVHLYEELGEECTQRLNGMFAFAIYDAPRRRLLLARDPLGIKPLHYAVSGNSLAFASEIKSVLCLPQVTREMDLQALDAYFTFGFIPSPLTIFKGIFKLPPATRLTFEDGRVRLHRYWSLSYGPKWELSEAETAERLRELLSAAVGRQLVSDVPLGAFLSGGVDSGSVVAAMSRVSGRPVDAFSLGYTGEAGDEVGLAAETARRCGAVHRVFRVTPDMTAILPRLLWHLDEPFFDNSILPTYLISRLAREEVKVVLSGDGGDELFGGYEWTRRDRYRALCQRLAPWLRKGADRLPEGGACPDDEYGRGLVARARRLHQDLSGDAEGGFRRRTTVSSGFRQALYSEGLKRDLNGFDAVALQQRLFAAAAAEDDVDKMLHVDMMSYLPEDCLCKVDRMSMAHGLEVRVPFLDRDLVEFAARIPCGLKLKGFTSKHILKRAVAPHLPRSILRQRKQGFTVPMASWLRSGLGDLAEKIVLGDSLHRRGLFNRDRLRWILAGHRSGRQEFGHRIWSLVVFETWAKLYLDAGVPSAPSADLKELAY